MIEVTQGRSALVRVPATSANLGPGFDTLGLALAVYDEVEVTAAPEGVLEIEVEGIGADSVPRDAEHLVVTSIATTLERFGARMPGLRLHARNSIPHGRGMGSSGAAIVAGVVAAAGLIGDQRDISNDELLAAATAIEGHPDNVAPSLFGGLTIAWLTMGGEPRSKQLLVHRGVSPVVLIPETTMSTKLARSLQPTSVPHADAIFNVSRSALLIAALAQNPELLLEATEDRLHQHYRAAAMPHTAELIGRLRDEGYAAVVSGAGPSILVLCDSPVQRLRVAELAGEHDAGNWQVIMPAVDVLGATVEVSVDKTGSPSA